MTIREVLFNSSTGDVNIENSDGATTSYNLADVVRVSTSSSGGLEIEDGSDLRGFVTAELSAGVPTGNFS